MNIPRSISRYIAVFTAFFLIGVSLFLPKNIFILLLGGRSIDVNGHLWYFWFTRKCLLSLDLKSLVHTNSIAYPSGKSILFDIGQPLLALFSIPFQIAFNFPFYYNLFALSVLALNGISAFLLLEHHFKDRPASFLGSLIFAINPYVLYQMNSGRLEQAALFWIPLFVLFLFEMGKQIKKIHSVGAAVVLLLACLSYWYYGMFLLLLAFIFLLFKKEKGQFFLKNFFRMLFTYGVFFALLFLPMLIKGMLPAGYEQLKPSLKNIISGNTPGYFHYLTSETSFKALPSSFLIFFCVIVAASLVNSKIRKNTGFYILAAFIFSIFSLGPKIVFFGHVLILPYLLPYYIIPFFSRLWWPLNCFSIALICLAVLSASLFLWLRSKTAPKIKPFLPVILCIFYLAPFYILKGNPFYSFSFDRPKSLPQAYYSLPEGPEGALLELPFQKVSMDFLYFQTLHEKRTFSCPGYSIKETVWPKNQLRYLRSNAFLNQLDLLFNGQIVSPEPEDLKTGIDKLFMDGFRFIVVNPEYFKEYGQKERVRADLEKLLGKPRDTYSDGSSLYNIGEILFTDTYNILAGSKINKSQVSCPGLLPDSKVPPALSGVFNALIIREEIDKDTPLYKMIYESNIKNKEKALERITGGMLKIYFDLGAPWGRWESNFRAFEKKLKECGLSGPPNLVIISHSHWPNYLGGLEFFQKNFPDVPVLISPDMQQGLVAFDIDSSDGSAEKRHKNARLIKIQSQIVLSPGLNKLSKHLSVLTLKFREKTPSMLLEKGEIAINKYKKEEEFENILAISTKKGTAIFATYMHASFLEVSEKIKNTGGKIILYCGGFEDNLSFLSQVKSGSPGLKFIFFHCAPVKEAAKSLNDNCVSEAYIGEKIFLNLEEK